ncbi:MAG: Chromate resistance protein ChrB [Dermatophilaceae bacterium]
MARDDQWVLLAYRLPRVPSTPRSAIWRRLKRLGVAKLADGLVALPADARTREALEWVAEEVLDHHGEAMVWLGRPADMAGATVLIQRMTAAIAAEYEAVTAEATTTWDTDETTRRRVAARLRRELHRLEDRDFFSPPQRDAARRAVEDLAANVAAVARS